MINARPTNARRFRGCFRFVLVAGVVIALIAIGVVARRGIAKPLAYWVIDDQTLGVVVVDAIYIECKVTRIEESADTVRISAECFEPVLPLPNAAALALNVLQVALQAPLANRGVLDGLGNPAVLCARPAPDCAPPY